MFIKKSAWRFWINSGLFLSFWMLTPGLSYAQIAGDETVSTDVTTSDNVNFTVDGGSRAGNNLFHSFSKFSVPENGSAIFNNTSDVENIISRVTGGSISNIDGLIKAEGSTNLFLINPNGIVFGPNAKLDIKGSFMATTATRLNFDDGKSFSTNDTSAQSLLSVSVPIGLQFGETVGNIRFIGNNADNDPTVSLLTLETGKTLALVGGDVLLEAGSLSAPGGRIEIGSVGASGTVQVEPISTGWKLNYDSGQNLQDIQLSQISYIDTTGDGNGDIQLYGRQIAITGGSQVGGFSDGTDQRGTLAVRASELVEVSGNGSSLFNLVDFDSPKPGAALNISIDTKHLVVSDGADITIFNSNVKDQPGGKLTINALESVEVNDSIISTEAFVDADAGEIRINTGSLTIRNGGIGSSTSGAGNGGTIVINASKFVEVSGQAEQNTEQSTLSGLFARTRRSAQGNGGIIKIDTGRLVIRDGGSISVEAADSSTGQAGTLDINAVNSVEVSGVGSSLQASSVSPKPAGNLTITTDKLVVQDGAKVNVSSINTGNAGNLTIAARTISLDNGGQLTATSGSGTGGGNITLQNLNSLLLRGRSEISTNAGGAGNGGNITITTDLLTALGNSKITANAEGAGNGGNIRIETQGFFVSPDSEITASSEQGIDGVVEIDRLENDPEGALLTLPVEPVNISGLIAQGCSSGGGSVARNSKFVVTGRGGLPPTPKEAFRGDVALADLGKPIETETTQAKVVAPTNQKPPELTPLVEAQGWVIGSKGEVILTASAPNVSPSIPWMKSSSCHG